MLINGYNNYEVSSFGRVRNNVTNLILKQYIRIDQRNRIGLQDRNKKTRKHLVHRLVALAFCNKPDGFDTVDHIDRNPQNNHISNLRWTNPGGNLRNKTKYKNNKSGKQGVIRCTNKKSNLHYWTVLITNNDFKRITKCFSIQKLGEDEAKRQAIECRKQLEIQYGYIGD